MEASSRAEMGIWAEMAGNMFAARAYERDVRYGNGKVGLGVLDYL